MEALAAVSKELAGYRSLHGRMTPYAGPQCFSHLDPEGGDYRVAANVPVQEGEEGAGDGGAGTAAGDVADAANWCRCDRCGCWRFVGRGCVGALREAQYFAVRDTDLDWESWLANAGARYRAVEAAGAGQDQGGGGATGEEQAGATWLVAGASEPEPGGGGRAGAPVAARRRRVRAKSSERAVAASAGAGGAAPESGAGADGARRGRKRLRRKLSQEEADAEEGAAPTPGRKRLREKTSEADADAARVAVQAVGGAVEGDGDEAGDSDARSASDFECASCDGADVWGAQGLSGPTRREFEEALEGLAGAGPLTEGDRKRRREAEDAERGAGACGVGLGAARVGRAFGVEYLRDRRERELRQAVREYLFGARIAAG